MKRPLRTLLFLIIAIVLTTTACATSYRTVLVTPPNYGIVINLNDPSSQVTANSLEGGTLMDVTQQTVTMKKCVSTFQSTDRCPDVMVVEVPGAYVTRLYTAEANSGTSNTKQSLCFEANGANGCVDFTVTAKVEKDGAKCYANKVGIVAVGDSEESRFHFKAISLEETMDNRVIGVASGKFSLVVATTSPLSLALDKYTIFEGIKQDIVNTVYDQTCITINPDDMYISNGIVWSDPTIQDQINQATILANQLELLAKKNDLLKQQTQALLDRAKLVEQEYGLSAAIRFMEIQTEQMKIEKWDGNSWLPFLSPVDGNPATPEPMVPETTSP